MQYTMDSPLATTTRTIKPCYGIKRTFWKYTVLTWAVIKIKIYKPKNE